MMNEQQKKYTNFPFESNSNFIFFYIQLKTQKGGFKAKMPPERVCC